MKILLSIPSQAEWNLLLPLWQESEMEAQEDGTLIYKNQILKPVLTGVGMLRTSYQLTQALHTTSSDIALQIGVAGASKTVPLGTAYAISSEELIDGVWEEGMLKTDFDLGLADPEEHPFRAGKLYPELPSNLWNSLPQATSITTTTLTDDPEWCEQRLQMAEASLENMEGAAFYYVNNRECIPSLQIRGVSNHVGIRDKSQWKIKEALEEAHKLLVEVLQNIINHDQNQT